MSAIDKAAARRAAKAVRSRAATDCPDAGHLVADVLKVEASTLGLSLPRKTVAVYLPIGSELDTGPVISLLTDLEHRVCLPVVEGQNAPLVFRKWAPGDPLIDSAFGTQVPVAAAPIVRPDIVFVPLLAFDAAGFRLGYGGGYYDRTIGELRAYGSVTTVGMAFAAQKIERLPRESHDQPLDWILTEEALTPVKQNERD